jgi:hypothetical protein
MTLPTPANPGPFGHKQRKNFLFDDNFTNYNHGSYGTFAFQDMKGRSYKGTEGVILTDIILMTNTLVFLGSFPKSVQENLLKWHNHAELNPGSCSK